MVREQQLICSGELRGIRARWAANKGRASTAAVAGGISMMGAGLPCDTEIERLLNQVTGATAMYKAAAARRASEARAFRVKQYEDAREFAFSHESSRHNERLASIDAARTVVWRSRRRSPSVGKGGWLYSDNGIGG